jgi:drug/metabolite transporter (DMT)-like permease
MSPPRIPHSLVATFLVVCWSSGFVGAELAARTTADPVTLLAWRFAVLSLVLVLICVLVGQGLPRRPAAWRRQGSVALLTQITYLALVFEGVNRGVPGGTAALLAALQPLLVATVAGPLLGERTSRRQWVGLLVGMAGVVLVVSGDLQVAGAPGWAYLLPVGAMLSLATGTVLERRIAPPESLLETVTLQACLTAAAFLLLAVGAGRAAPPADADFWAAVAWLVVLASLGGYGSYVLVARRRGATHVSALLYLTPPTTLLWVFLMFGEPVPLAGLAGLMVSGVGIAIYGVRRSAPSGARDGEAVGHREDRPAAERFA